jgi:hypothetical protein
VRELNEQIEKQKRHEAEYARWQKVKARDEGRLKELAVELDVLKKTKTGLQRRLQQESSQYRPLILASTVFWYQINGANRYKEWKASHNTELAKVRRQAKQVPPRARTRNLMSDCCAGGDEDFEVGGRERSAARGSTQAGGGEGCRAAAHARRGVALGCCR